MPSHLCNGKQHHLSRCLPVYTPLRMVIWAVHMASSSTRTITHHVTLDLYQSSRISLNCNKGQKLIVTYHYVRQSATVRTQIHNTEARVKSSVNTSTQSGLNNCQYLLQHWEQWCEAFPSDFESPICIRNSKLKRQFALSHRDMLDYTE